MSTLAYAAFTNKRESAVPDSSSTISPGVKTYVDALAALVPAEVLTLHGLILTVTTKELDGGKAEIVTGALPTLQISFWLLALLCIPLFAVPRAYGGKWDRFDFVRMMIAPLAFVGWTMLQPMTAFG